MRATTPLVGAGLALALCLAVSLAGGGSAAGGPLGDGAALDRVRGWLMTTGFSPPERDPTSGDSFSWSGGRASLAVPRLDRATPYRFALVVQAGRPGPQPVFPTVTVRVDGVRVLDTVVGNDRTTVTVDVPPSTHDALRIDLEVNPTFVPSAQDQRQLGVVVRRVSLTPADGTRFPLPTRSLLETALGAALLSTILALFAVPAWVRAAGALAIGAAATFFFWFDLAMLGPWPSRLVWTAAVALGIGLVLRAAVGRWGSARTDAALQTAIALLLVGTGIKWWWFVHPQINVGDALFHVHRAEWVWNGRYFFTSITPRPFFEFPYAIGFYIAAWPFSPLSSTPAERILLLRSLALWADTAAGLAVLLLARRFWPRGVALPIAALVYVTCRLSTQVLFAANLTNLFAQALFTIAVAVLVLWSPGRGWVARAGAGTVALAGSFLSHFSTLMVGVPTMSALAAGPWTKGTREQKRHATWMLLVLVASLGVAYAVYYSHFHDVYAATFARVAAREGEAATRSIAAPPGVKAARLSAETVRNFGWPLLLTAVAGLALLRRAARDDTLTRVVYAWSLAWLLLTGLGVLTAVELRANLSFQPVVVLLATCTLALWAERGVVGKWLAIAAGLVIASDGIREWIWCVAGTP